MESKLTFSESLRALADLVEKSEVLNVGKAFLAFNFFFDTKDEIAEQVRLLGGSWKKRYGDTFFSVDREVGCLGLSLNIYREKVCTRKQVGTRIIPASEEHEEPVYEWDCPQEPLLVDASKPEATND